MRQTVLPTQNNSKMETSKFWDITETIDPGALRQGNEDRALAPLIDALSGLAVTELDEYQEQLCRALYAIDGEEFADNAGESGTSGDGFLYCRCYVVARGREHFAKVLKDPALMPKGLEWCEGLLYVVGEAWSKVTGKESKEWTDASSVSYETGSNSRLWPSLPVETVVPDSDEELFTEPNLQRAVSRAGHSFRAKEFKYVVLLLGPHRKSLSPKQLRTLNEAEEKLKE